MAQPAQPVTPTPTPNPPPTSLRPRSRARFRPQDIAKRKTHGLLGQLNTLIFQPRLFFHTFPNTRQWLLIASLALVVTGYSAVQKNTLGASASSDPNAFISPDSGGDFSVSGGGDVSGGGGVVDPFAAPLPDSGGLGVDGGTAVPNDINAQLSTAVTSAAWIVITWLLQAMLFWQVSLFNGVAPSLGKNLQIAVWASLPLIIMVVLQIAFRGAGGKGMAVGMTALVQNWTDFPTYPASLQLLIYSALSQVTLFSVWNLFLLYVGAREALKGKWFPSVLVAVGWVFIAVVVPVVLGRVQMTINGVPLL